MRVKKTSNKPTNIFGERASKASYGIFEGEKQVGGCSCVGGLWDAWTYEDGRLTTYGLRTLNELRKLVAAYQR
jgi:hypothetical protein